MLLNNLDWFKSYLCNKIMQGSVNDLYPFVFLQAERLSNPFRSITSFTDWCNNPWVIDEEDMSDDVRIKDANNGMYLGDYHSYRAFYEEGSDSKWMGTTTDRMEQCFLHFSGNSKEECEENLKKLVRDYDEPFTFNFVARSGASAFLTYDEEQGLWRGIAFYQKRTRFIEGISFPAALLEIDIFAKETEIGIIRKDNI